jgi:hypothetical protein
MLKSATTLLAALTAGWVLFGAPTMASAGEDCGACKPTRVVHNKYRTTEGKEITVTHHKRIEEHVRVRHTIVTITHIQPIDHVHDVTIYEHYKIPEPYVVRVHHDELLPAKVVTDYRRVDHYHGCGCGGY